MDVLEQAHKRIMTIEYFFRQLKVSDFGYIVDNSYCRQRWQWAGWRFRKGKHLLLWLYGFGTFFRQHTCWFSDGQWHAPQWFWFYKGVPFIRIPMNAEEDAEIYVFVCVSGAAFPGSTAEIIALTNPASLFVAHFGASPFNTVSGPFSLVIPWYFIAREQLFGQVRYLYSL